MTLPDKTADLVQLEIPEGVTITANLDRLDYLSLFIPAGAVEGVRVNVWLLLRVAIRIPLELFGSCKLPNHERTEYSGMEYRSKFYFW